ncbi:MAG: cytochrome C, partial [Chlorobium limicola]|nr:cytochrome C [Chlorobium limicola]
YWPISHMVSPKEKSLSCRECHSRSGRLQSLSGFYLMGRDTNPFVEYFGLLAISGSLIGVIIHSIIRYFTVKKLKKAGGK